MPVVVTGPTGHVGATLIRALIDAGRAVRYLLGGHWHAVKEVAEMVAEAAGRSMPNRVVPMWLARAATPLASLHARLTGGPPRFTRASLHALCHHQQVRWDKAARYLDYQPRPFRETVADTLAWFSGEGLLEA